MLRIAVFQNGNHGRGIKPVHDLINSVRLIAPQDVNHSGHSCHVEIKANVQHVSRLHRLATGIQGAVKLWVNTAGGQVDELALKVRGQQV